MELGFARNEANNNNQIDNWEKAICVKEQMVAQNKTNNNDQNHNVLSVVGVNLQMLRNCQLRKTNDTTKIKSMFGKKWLGVNGQTLWMRDLCKTKSMQTITCTIAVGCWANVVEFKFAENDANYNNQLDNWKNGWV